MEIEKKVKSSTSKSELKKRELKKIQSIKYSKLARGVSDITDKTKIRIENCGSFLDFISDFEHEKHKLVSANFCGHRFCPHCSYSKARKDAFQTSIIVDYLKSQGYKFIFLTLTAPNISGSELEKEIRSYSKAFKRLFDLKEVKSITKGYMRKLEITYNSESDTFHPHYHIIIAVSSSYFTDTKAYLSREKWLDYWRKAKRDERITQVDVRKLSTSADKGILEITKYIAKDSNYMHSEGVFKAFYGALKGKRTYSYKGVFKEAVKLYKNGDLDYLKDVDTTEYLYRVWYNWNSSSSQYKCVLDAELTALDYDKYNNFVKKEMDIE